MTQLDALKMTYRHSSSINSLLLVVLYLVFITFHPSSQSCHFPPNTFMDVKDPPWYTHVTTRQSGDIEFYIRRNVMEVHQTKSKRGALRWSCVMKHKGSYLVKRQDYLANSYYKCVHFYQRSHSILQLAWSSERKSFDLHLCDHSRLRVDPWLLIKFERIDTDYVPIPFSGGFDIKIWDNRDVENGCNLMQRPMRMEIECLGGEGVLFDFITEACIPGVKMFVRQKTTSIATWNDTNYNYVILRKMGFEDLWCLKVPRQLSNKMHAYLYIDLICGSEVSHPLGMQKHKKKHINFLNLELKRRIFKTLCEDEYNQCQTAVCNQYIEQECMKSCHVCDHKTPIVNCNFPEKFQDTWILKGLNTTRKISITKSQFNIEGVGGFQCVNVSGKMDTTNQMYPTLSIFHNGCRPRHTCLQLRHLQNSVMQYSISQSQAWPHFNNPLDKQICSADQFRPDASPIDDLYRSDLGSGKPIVSLTNLHPISCNLTSMSTVTAKNSQGYLCTGSIFRHCQDLSRVRLDFSSCGGLIPMITDFQCLASFPAHYWENIVMIQSLHDYEDIRCFVFSQYYPNEAYILTGSHCDQNSFYYARSKIRQPLLTLKFRSDDTSCVDIPTTPFSATTQPLPTTAVRLSTLSRKDNLTRADQGRPSWSNHNTRNTASINKIDNKDKARPHYDRIKEKDDSEQDELRVSSRKTDRNGAPLHFNILLYNIVAMLNVILLNFCVQ